MLRLRLLAWSKIKKSKKIWESRSVTRRSDVLRGKGRAARGETKDGLKFSGDATDRKAAPLVDCQLFFEFCQFLSAAPTSLA